MSTQYAVVFPTELFDTELEAHCYASKYLLEEHLSDGLYVISVEKKTHLKAVVQVMEDLK